MRNSLKVAKWEIKRNVTNKSFVISLLITPLIFMLFFFVPSLIGGSDSGKPVKVYVHDELHVWDELQAVVANQDLDWKLEKTDKDEESFREELAEAKKTVFIPLTEQSLEQGKVNVYMSEDMDKDFILEANLLEMPLRQLQMDQLGLTEEQKLIIAQGITMEPIVEETGSEKTGTAGEGDKDPLERAVPGIFAGVILFSIVMTGMMIFTSASQEKKEKVAEIILSSVTPGDLMQGKIFGYFVLGIIQVAVWMAFALPLFIWKFDMPLLDYLLVPELLLLLVIALAGYLLFAAVFVGIGATVEDLTSTSNFQGMVMMLPFVPLLFISPVLNDPNGLAAKVGSFIPFTAPGVLLMRLSVLDEWPWIELIIALAVLFISIWVMMKLAGKVFKVGILMYGKNATPKEIWKWMWT